MKSFFPFAAFASFARPSKTRHHRLPVATPSSGVDHLPVIFAAYFVLDSISCPFLLQPPANNNANDAVKYAKRDESYWHNPHENSIFNHAGVWIICAIKN